MSTDMLTVFIGILTIVQVVVGALAWYVGIQVKMLRLELVTVTKCDSRHDRLESKVSKALNELSAIKATVCGINHSDMSGR